MECKDDNLDWTSGHFSSLSDNLHPNAQLPEGSKSYPPSSSVYPLSTMSSNQGSLNPLQISVIALKDRCVKHQRRIDLLEEENCRLYYALGVSNLPCKDDVSSNQGLHSRGKDDHLEALNRLQEANFLLRQRNLELNQKLLHKSEALLKLKAQSLEGNGHISTSNKIELVTNYEKGPCKSNTKSATSGNGRVDDSEVEEDDDEEQATHEMTDLLRNDSNKSLSRIQLTEQNMHELKERLLSQQKIMMKAVKNMSASFPTNQNKKQNSQFNNNVHQTLGIKDSFTTLLNQTDTTEEDMCGEESKENNQRLCPMCEANFPYDEILQEDFEAHVLGHFSYEEEAETLTHYDMVLDAQRSLDGDF